MVRKIEGACSLRAAARESSVSVATAHRWWHRHCAALLDERAGLGWAQARSSRPRRSPRRLGAEQEAWILRARARTGLGPARLAGICRRPCSTVWKVLHRHGLSRWRSSRPRQSFRRYEWSQPGALRTWTASAWSALPTHQPSPRPRPVIVPALLQPPAAPQQPQRPATHHPHSQRTWAGQLAPSRPVHPHVRCHTPAGPVARVHSRWWPTTG